LRLLSQAHGADHFIIVDTLADQCLKGSLHGRHSLSSNDFESNSTGKIAAMHLDFSEAIDSIPDGIR
ncbi:MAG: hypothetical protein ACXV8S_13850, partial [Methylobacter sp.]